jgi:hypothetical protein
MSPSCLFSFPDPNKQSDLGIIYLTTLFQLQMSYVTQRLTLTNIYENGDNSFHSISLNMCHIEVCKPIRPNTHGLNFIKFLQRTYKI